MHVAKQGSDDSENDKFFASLTCSTTLFLLLKKIFKLKGKDEAMQ